METGVNKVYHGLVNHGATCYLNSVLQVLFMTKDFRETVQRLTSQSPGIIDDHLKGLFDQLLQRTAVTREIMKILHIDRVNEQQDAAEYLLKILNASSAAKKIFHGEVTSSVICEVCKTQTDRDAPFWYLPLPLIDPCSGDFTVVGGLENFFKTSYLSGENQMYCEQSDTKVDAVRRTIVKHHPDVLILLLKRFDFNYYYMTYIKINSVVDVPFTLEVPENQSYELYAVVDHYGDLRSGHYSATIKDEDRWYFFDDTQVTQIPTSVLDNENIVKSHSAYLLFYRKKVTDALENQFNLRGDPNSTRNNCNQHPEAEPGRTTEVSERAEEVSPDTLTVAFDNGTKHTNIASVSRKKEKCPEKPTEQVSLNWKQEEKIINEEKEDEKLEKEMKNLFPNDAQIRVQESENPEETESNEIRAGDVHERKKFGDNGVEEGDEGSRKADVKGQTEEKIHANQIKVQKVYLTKYDLYLASLQRVEEIKLKKEREGKGLVS